MSRQRVDVEWLGGLLAGGWGRYRDGDLMLAGRDGGGGSAGNAVVGTDQDAGSGLVMAAPTMPIAIGGSNSFPRKEGGSRLK
jgi:hypothetical protein